MNTTNRKSNSFANMWSVMRKELRDVSRDHKTLAIALLFGALMYPVLIFGGAALGESHAKTQLEKVLEVPVIGAERAPNLIAYLATQGINTVVAPKDLEAAIGRQDVDVALEIDANYAKDWRAGRPALVELVQDSSSRNAEIPGMRVRTALTNYASQVGALRLISRGIDPSVVRAVNVGDRDLASLTAKRGRMMAFMLPYLLIFTSFIGGAYLILDATAGERERQSLEPLLATPATRGAIVSGKIAAACVLGMTSLLLTLLSLRLSSYLAPSAAQFNSGFAAIGQMLLILLPMVFIGTTLLTYLAASAKSMKEAQSHLTWLMLLPMIPSFVLMANPVKTELWQFAVPFLAQNQLLLKVIRAEPIDAQTWAIYLACGFGLAALLWFAAVRRYHQEKLAISG